MSADAVWSIDWSAHSRTDPGECADWCDERHEGHWPAGVSSECSSELEEMTVSTGEWVGDGGISDDDPAEMVPDYVGVYLWRSLDGTTTVNVSHHEQVGMPLTPDEARELAGVLLRLASRADSGA